MNWLWGMSSRSKFGRHETINIIYWEPTACKNIRLAPYTHSLKGMVCLSLHVFTGRWLLSTYCLLQVSGWTPSTQLLCGPESTGAQIKNRKSPSFCRTAQRRILSMAAPARPRNKQRWSPSSPAMGRGLLPASVSRWTGLLLWLAYRPPQYNRLEQGAFHVGRAHSLCD